MANSNHRVALAVLVIVGAFAAAFAPPTEAAYLRNVPQTLDQPDGTVVTCFASGDEFFNFWHDESGFVIIRDDDGWLKYATRVGDELRASQLVVGHSDPAKAGITPWLRPGRSVIERVTKSFASPARVRTLGTRMAPEFTTLNNLVFFVLFADEEFEIFDHSVSQYDTLYNSTATGANSVKNFFKEASYQQLTLNSAVANAAFRDSQPRSYYRPYNATSNPNGYQGEDERAEREHTLLGRVVNAYVNGGYIPTGLNVDTNNDGYVDNVTFIVSGSPDGWSSMIWPHRWFMSADYPVVVRINGKEVDAYNFNLDSVTWDSQQGVGVLCHEMTHTLGAPDLYHYLDKGKDLAPVGPWDLMENTANPPQHTAVYVKMRYLGWLNSINPITSSGTYTLNPITSASNNAFRIASPNSSNEYFIVEYRRKAGSFESSLPGSGLIVYRINTTVNDGSGNRNGPPDEVYIYRPGGSPTDDGEILSAHFSSETGRRAINDTTDPDSHLSNGSPGGLNISQVGSAGGTISFYVTIGGSQQCTYSLSSSSASMTAAGGEGTVSVSTQTSCSWSASSSAAWLTIVSGASGSGNGTVRYRASANTSTSQRAGTLTIGGQAFTVNQSGTGGGGGSYVYWIETAAKASGSGGANWRTDVGALNLGSGQADMTFQLFIGSNPKKGSSLTAKAMSIYADIVGQFGTAGSGALKITSNQPLAVTSRTYNDQGANGTFGQYYDSFTTDQMLSAGAVVYLSQLIENAKYRSNIAVTNAGTGNASVRVTLYAYNGTQLAQYQVDLTSGQRKQENQVFLKKANQSSLPGGYAKVEVLSGAGVIVSASVIDNKTGDPTTIPPKR
jgi:M6 family metalloprotease-like protein